MSQFAELLWQSSLLVVVASVAVLVTQRLLSNTLSPQHHYLLWLSVPLGLIASFLQPEALSAYQVSSKALKDWNHLVASKESAGLDLSQLFVFAWLCGFVIKATLTFVQEYQFHRQLKVIGVWPSQRNRLGQRAQVLQVARCSTPCLVGVLKPKILLPNGLDRQEHALVLQHELSHFTNGDHLWNAIAHALSHVFWFIPFNQQLVNLFSKTQELACDARVLQQISSKEKPRYAQLLLKLTTQPLTAATAIGWGSPSLIKERITMMNKKHNKLGSLIALSFIASTAIFSSLVQAEPDIQPLATVAPQWPQAALSQGIEGQVTMAITINDKGEVVKAKVVNSSNEIFNKNAVKAIKQWKFAKNTAGTFNYQLDFSMG